MNTTMKLKNKNAAAAAAAAAAPVIHRADAETLMNELAGKTNEKRALVARLDAAVLKLHEDATPEISACDEVISARSEALRSWAESHPGEFPRGRKSIALLGGVVGFRLGTPRLALLSRAFKWEGVVELLKQKGWTSFIRTKAEPDKDGLLAQRERYNLREIGLKVVQEESFYAEPRLTAAEAAAAGK
jgi:phage host-nuclease inhibitor protein Gam